MSCVSSPPYPVHYTTTVSRIAVHQLFALWASTPRPTTGCTLKIGERIWTGDYTHTLLAHLVTLRPSFMHSNSPLPGLSVLHFI